MMRKFKESICLLLNRDITAAPESFITFAMIVSVSLREVAAIGLLDCVHEKADKKNSSNSKYGTILRRILCSCISPAVFWNFFVDWKYLSLFGIYNHLASVAVEFQLKTHSIGKRQMKWKSIRNRLVMNGRTPPQAIPDTVFASHQCHLLLMIEFKGLIHMGGTMAMVEIL